MDTLYDILEISEKASDEVIKKTYKVLAKRYHPDIQKLEDKEQCENKMKQINEAYENLINTEKRIQYDEKLKNDRIIEKRNEYEKIKEEILKEYIDKYKNKQEQLVQNTIYNKPNRVQQEEKINYKKVYNNKEYIKEYKKQLRKIRIKKVKDLIITLLIMMGIIILLWIIPPTHKIIMNFYEQNIIVKTIVDIILKSKEN